MTEPFTVQAGKRYVRRDGEISGVLTVDGSQFESEEWVLCDPKTSQTYRINGTNSINSGRDTACDLISEYTEPTAEPQDEWGPWIGWNGGECPVDGGVKIQVISQAIMRWDRTASEVVWNSPNNIIAYRVKKEPVVTTDTVWIDDSTGQVWDCRRGYQANFIFDGFTRAIITLTDGKPSIEWADK